MNYEEKYTACSSVSLYPALNGSFSAPVDINWKQQHLWVLKNNKEAEDVSERDLS